MWTGAEACGGCWTRYSGDASADKLGGITARVATCKTQIDAMGASKQKATTVLSSSKYPAGTVLADFQSVYVPLMDARGRQQVRLNFVCCARRLSAALDGTLHSGSLGVRDAPKRKRDA